MGGVIQYKLEVPYFKHRISFNMSLTIPNLVPQRPFCYLNFICVDKIQDWK